MVIRVTYHGKSGKAINYIRHFGENDDSGQILHEMIQSFTSYKRGGLLRDFKVYKVLEDNPYGEGEILYES